MHLRGNGNGTRNASSVDHGRERRQPTVADLRQDLNRGGGIPMGRKMRPQLRLATAPAVSQDPAGLLHRATPWPILRPFRSTVRHPPSVFNIEHGSITREAPSLRGRFGSEMSDGPSEDDSDFSVAATNIARKGGISSGLFATVKISQMPEKMIEVVVEPWLTMMSQWPILNPNTMPKYSYTKLTV